MKATRYKMYLGRNMPDGMRVDRCEFNRWFDRENELNAWTLYYDISGGWEGVPEDTVIIEILIPATTMPAILQFNADINDLIEVERFIALAESYKDNFMQDAVLIVREQVDMDLI